MHKNLADIPHLPFKEQSKVLLRWQTEVEADFGCMVLSGNPCRAR